MTGFAKRDKLEFKEAMPWMEDTDIMHHPIYLIDKELPCNNNWGSLVGQDFLHLL